VAVVVLLAEYICDLLVVMLVVWWYDVIYIVGVDENEEVSARFVIVMLAFWDVDFEWVLWVGDFVRFIVMYDFLLYDVDG